MSENPRPKRNKLLIYRWSINLFLKLLNDWVPTTELGSEFHIIYLRNTSKRNISKCFSQKRYEKVKYLSNSIFDKPVINLNNCNKLRNYQWKRNSIQPKYFKRSAYLSLLPRIHVETFLCILSNLSRLMKCL